MKRTFLKKGLTVTAPPKLAQSTKDMDWGAIELVTFANGNTPATGYVCLPSRNVLHPITVTGTTLAADPLKGSAK